MTPEQFREVRLSLGLNQSDLGELIGYGQQHISGWENGKNAIPRIVVIAMRAIQRLGHPDVWSL